MDSERCSSCGRPLQRASLFYCASCANPLCPTCWNTNSGFCDLCLKDTIDLEEDSWPE